MNFMNGIKKNLGYIAVAFMSLSYVATAIVTIEQTGKSIYQIIADGVIAFLFGFFLTKSFELQGMSDGERDDRVLRTLSLHENTVISIIPYIDYLDDWCEVKNKENYRLQRTRILARGGIHYYDAFDEEGVAKEITPTPAEKLKTREQRLNDHLKNKAYRKACTLRLTEITPADLTGVGRNKSDDIYDMGRTKADYEKSVTRKQVISHSVTAFFFGYYGVALIKDFNWENLVWNVLQVSMFLVMGVIKMYQAYSFIITEYRSGIVKKIDLLQKFQSFVKKTHPDAIQESEDNKDVGIQ